MASDSFAVDVCIFSCVNTMVVLLGILVDQILYIRLQKRFNRPPVPPKSEF